METMMYLLVSTVAGLTFYVLAFSLLLVAFVADRFLKDPDTVSFLCAGRGLLLLRATCALCLLAMLFAMDTPGGLIVLMFVQALVAGPLARASLQSEVFRPERMTILYRLLWATIPTTFGAAVLADLQHVGSWSEWFAGPILSLLPQG